MLRAAQLLLVLAAGALWVASRLPWVIVRSFDGLGPPKEVTLSGAAWSTALVPLALLMLAAAVAAIAVRGWPLRVLAGLLAVASLAIAYLGISLWKVPDVAVRGAELAHLSVVWLVGSERRYVGAGVAVGAAVCSLVAAVLLMRSASDSGASRLSADRYAAPATRRSMAARRGDADAAGPAGSPRNRRCPSGCSGTRWTRVATRPTVWRPGHRGSVTGHEPTAATLQ